MKSNVETPDWSTIPAPVAGGMTLLKRLTLVIDDGTIEHVFYPVFPPDENASEVVEWLSGTAV